MSRTRPAAFTLVELLVVIGIIALLISILLPALNRARASANSLKCLSNLRSVGQGIVMYANAHKGVLPLGKWDGGYSGSPKATDWSYLIHALMVKNSDGTYGTRTEGLNVRRLFTCPDAREAVGIAEGTDMLHYSSHPRLMPSINDDDKTKPTPYPKMKPYNLGGIKRAAEIVLIMDGVQIAPNAYRANSTAYRIDNDYSYAPTSRYQSTPFLNFDAANADNGTSVKGQINIDANAYSGSDGGIRWRHLKNNSANFLFCDGHAEPRGWKSGSVTDLKRSNVNVNIR